MIENGIGIGDILNDKITAAIELINNESDKLESNKDQKYYDKIEGADIEAHQELVHSLERMMVSAKLEMPFNFGIVAESLNKINIENAKDAGHILWQAGNLANKNVKQIDAKVNLSQVKDDIQEVLYDKITQKETQEQDQKKSQKL